ncbi:rRNA maturation RNase YbeY [Candidatus Sumerlaeota bacterium]|nr:rRNA maturation RNase YbeY [Candidatus Sumerlaeota bacterium]
MARHLAALGREGAGVGVLFCGPREMRQLKRTWFGIDEETDVLSFPSGDEDYLGDVAVCLPVCARQARAQGQRTEEEVALLLTHGLLHLLGHDHDNARRKARMWRRQDALLRGCGDIAKPRLVVMT